MLVSLHLPPFLLGRKGRRAYAAPGDKSTPFHGSNGLQPPWQSTSTRAGPPNQRPPLPPHPRPPAPPNPRPRPLSSQAWKTIILAGMYFVWMFVEVVKSGWAWHLLWPGLTGSFVGLAVLAFSAIGPGAIADVMQSQAQQKVSASEANVILSSEPLWARTSPTVSTHSSLFPVLVPSSSVFFDLFSIFLFPIFHTSRPVSLMLSHAISPPSPSLLHPRILLEHQVFGLDFGFF